MMPRWRRLRMMVLGLGSTLAWGLLAPSSGLAGPGNPPAAKVLWQKSRSFRIPVNYAPEHRASIREMYLYVSDDQGYGWRKILTTTPDKPEFAFRAPRDGEYWFAVQTLDIKGRLFPSDDRPADPTLKVIVDSVPPTIVLEPKGRRGSDAGVRWEIQDEHLLPRTLTLEYQATGARDWRQVPLAPSEQTLLGMKTWDAGTADTIRVRMSVRDRAGNVRTVEQVLPDGLAANPGPAMSDVRPANAAPQVSPITSRAAPTPSANEKDPFAAVDAPPEPAPSRGAGRPAAAASRTDTARDEEFESAPATTPAPRSNAPAPGAGQTLLVPSPRFPLKYAVDDAGPDGPAHVVLWTTRDGGRNWSRQPEDADRTSPYDVDLGGEGTFGLWLEVRSSTGLGDPPPAPGDAPQSWVEVDSEPPVVAMDRPRVGTGANANKVLLNWRASDAHLASKSVTISYRLDRADAPWVVIVDRQDNSGRYVWNVPANVPPRIHVKVEATDTLGNRGSADTQDLGPVVLDRARPRGRIIGLEQGGGTARQ